MCVVRCDSYRSAIAVIVVVHARVRHICARKACALLDRLLSAFAHDYRNVRVVLWETYSFRHNWDCEQHVQAIHIGLAFIINYVFRVVRGLVPPTVTYVDALSTTVGVCIVMSRLSLAVCKLALHFEWVRTEIDTLVTF